MDSTCCYFFRNSLVNKLNHFVITSRNSKTRNDSILLNEKLSNFLLNTWVIFPDGLLTGTSFYNSLYPGSRGPFSKKKDTSGTKVTYTVDRSLKLVLEFFSSTLKMSDNHPAFKNGVFFSAHNVEKIKFPLSLRSQRFCFRSYFQVVSLP